MVVGNERCVGLGEVAEQWLRSMKLRIKESSYVKYHNLLRNPILPEFRDVDVRELTTERVEEFVMKMLADGKCGGKGGLSEKTVRDMIAVLKGICLYAARRNIVIPCRFELIRLRLPKGNVQILAENDQRRLEDFLMHDDSLLKTGVLMSLYMGLRLGEICALKKKNIRQRERILQVRLTMQRIQNLEEESRSRTKIVVTEPKSESSVRDIPIPAFLARRLEALEYAPSDAYILTGSEERFVEPRTMENIFRRYLRECQVEEINYHALRHTFATRCIEKGFDVKSLSEILGHANVNITLNRYVHSSMEQKRKYMESLML